MENISNQSTEIHPWSNNDCTADVEGVTERKGGTVAMPAVTTTGHLRKTPGGLSTVQVKGVGITVVSLTIEVIIPMQAGVSSANVNFSIRYKIS
jgi:hypothetical protein